ncbi:MAG TPA: hypothetical protein VLT59_00435, partial [Steroidobacteraceae bacterium]|nr:hypothetical protein [Steroidobacteraceae bacterium]
NFLLIECTDPAAAMAAARSRQLIVRDFSRYPLLEGCVRVSIGTPEQNDRLIAALTAIEEART